MAASDILQAAESHRAKLGGRLHDQVVDALYDEAERIADRAVTQEGKKKKLQLDQALDRILTSRIWGFPVMICMFAGAFWLTIAGANVPSAMLGDLLLGTVYDWLHGVAQSISTPNWLSGFLIDGVYMAMAWVISVMLPPMAIFFRCSKISVIFLASHLISIALSSPLERTANSRSR
jgi:ferrous iron transport protein B